MVIENRKYARAKLDCEIMYPTIIQNETRKTFMQDQQLFAVDISEAGICLRSKFYIPTESFISFYLRLEDNLPFKALVKMRWNKIEDSSYVSGGEFVALSLEDIHILRNYVNTHKTL